MLTRHHEAQSHDQASPVLDAALTARLRGVAARLRRYVLIEGVAWVVGFLLLASLVQFTVDYWSRGLRWSMRAAMLGFVLAAAAYVIWRRVLKPARRLSRRRLGLVEIANLLERRYPQLGSVLISATRFAAGEVGSSEANSPAMIASVIRSAGRQAASVDFQPVLDGRRARRSILALAGAAVFVLTVSLTATDATALWFSRNVLLQNVPWPKRTHLVVQFDGDELIAARGDDVVIEATARGTQPREVELFFTTISGERGRDAMTTVGSAGSYRYRYTFKNAQEDLSFHLEGGDDRTATYHVRLLERPRVESSEIHILPPAYTRMDSRTPADGQRAVEVLRGSRITISIETNKPLARATLMAGSDVVAQAVLENGRYSAMVSPLETHTYHFSLLDRANLENRRPVRFSIRVVKDDPPRVRIRLEGVGDMITPEAILPIEVSCSDKYGLATVELVYHVLREEADEALIELPTFEPHASRFFASVTWPVTQAGLVPGDRVMLKARATDFDDVSGPNFAQSAELSLRVVTRDELLAELARREQEHRLSLERLVETQEQVRGRLLSARARFDDATRLEELAAALTPLERRQRNLAGAVNGLRQQLQQILSQLRVNQLDTKDEVRRLGDGIIDPLTKLARRDLIEAADTIRQWSRSGSPELASLVDRQEAAAVAGMRAVLANMVQWEGYHEVVTMLRDIIRLQKELGEEARQALLEEAEAVFDD